MLHGKFSRFFSFVSLYSIFQPESLLVLIDVKVAKDAIIFFQIRNTMTSCLTEDPDKLLNEWLGELENLIGVSITIVYHINASRMFQLLK